MRVEPEVDRFRPTRNKSIYEILVAFNFRRALRQPLIDLHRASFFFFLPFTFLASFIAGLSGLVGDFVAGIRLARVDVKFRPLPHLQRFGPLAIEGSRLADLTQISVGNAFAIETHTIHVLPNPILFSQSKSKEERQK